MKNNSGTLLFAYWVSCTLQLSQCCSFGHDDLSRRSPVDYTPVITANKLARDQRLSRRKAAPSRFAITNTHIFNGVGLSPASTVIVHDGLIEAVCTPECALVSVPAEATYDAGGMTLLPGLMDSHAHPSNVTHLTALTASGVTTTVLANCAVAALCASLDDHPGLTTLTRASLAATSPNSTHAAMLLAQGVTLSRLIANLAQIPSWITTEVSTGGAFIKIIGSAPGTGLQPAALTLLVREAHAAGIIVVLHASSTVAFAQGVAAGADQVHHSTLDEAADDGLVAAYVAAGTVVCPTLTMMRAIVEQLNPAGASFDAAVKTARRLHAAGVELLVGTDGNWEATSPARVLFGSSVHDELENMVRLVGMSPVEALRAATEKPARAFGLVDRGVVAVGKRADLVLVEGDPTVDIKSARAVRRVWVGGIEFRE
ncbi:hypothetical protein B0T18DRAFT_400782 [Schizothecium vesticola]|uniref:Amidohydrolase-related domain-containing protein n=1 Tax=Schizothecium vesticola TaxID=314040 RepID=A0AA40FCC5_9PEZI|nr:hypothetical protein B0T18DRAFT_400782 [Schizothecium vesticola]